MTESRTYFAEVAQEWDELRSGYFTEVMRDAAIARAELEPQDVVADVGTGTGFVARGLALQVVKVYGYDQSPEMLEVARQNLADFDNVELRQAPGDSLPLPDESVNAVFANMYLHHAPDPTAAIVEMVRILRPGGRLVLTDLDQHDQEWMRDEMADRWLGFAREDVRVWYEAAGLHEVVVGCAEGSCCTSAPDGSDLALSIFVAIGKKV